ncbi:MAG: type I restriction enzyme HsdR N-terminal domain-containing protein [Candidatus Electrothrix aestuarii]|uniref:Type I restriction enzyme HsdR N-terminal domain-containing protein n=1 Tax=Candidatus Electrothrix aestuarii TaxID=3062594 RepID=A0AAU8M1B3_9BACT|nr:type I restriction enzyme HsdR N-terminal domain-containing protein [Candidatus Electrothrix aestuarii]
MQRKNPDHHLVYGTLKDYLTGEELPDTDDERLRQELARMMVEEKGFKPEELEPRLSVETIFNHVFVRSVIDLTVSWKGQRLLVLRYGPGSLVTREKPALAAARVLESSYCIPLAVVTNGRDAELLETRTGKVLATGMEAIPDRVRAEELAQEYLAYPPPTGAARERNLRVLNAFDLEVCCRNFSLGLF